VFVCKKPFEHSTTIAVGQSQCQEKPNRHDWHQRRTFPPWYDKQAQGFQLVALGAGYQQRFAKAILERMQKINRYGGVKWASTRRILPKVGFPSLAAAALEGCWLEIMIVGAHGIWEVWSVYIGLNVDVNGLQLMRNQLDSQSTSISFRPGWALITLFKNAFGLD